MDKEIEIGGIDDGSGLTLSSSRSTQISLEAVRNGKAGLDAHRQGMFDKIPKQGNRASFKKDSIELKDLAYLTAKVGDEFALLRGKHEDILYHGSRGECTFLGDLERRLKSHQLELIGHAHPGEPVPIPSRADRIILNSLSHCEPI